MKISPWFLVGVLFAVVSVACGSLAAHALKPMLQERQTLDVFHIAKDYLGYHGLVLMLLAMAIDRWPSIKIHRPTRLIALGAFVFSLSLFSYAATGIKTLAHIAPIGGGLMILGWLWLTVISFNAVQRSN